MCWVQSLFHKLFLYLFSHGIKARLPFFLIFSPSCLTNLLKPQSPKKDENKKFSILNLILSILQLSDWMKEIFEDGLSRLECILGEEGRLVILLEMLRLLKYLIPLIVYGMTKTPWLSPTYTNDYGLPNYWLWLINF